MAEPRTILVIDDEPLVRFSITAYLEDSGYTCMEAQDGQEGLEVFAKFNPDIVVTDLRMPRLDGFEVVKALQKMSPATPVIIITGTGDLEAADQVKALGARDCLFKPLAEMALLLTAIRALTDSP